MEETYAQESHLAVVALGASAGGLEALDRFFASLKPTDDAAFVVVQHLAPEHKTMMDTLLARHTAMKVQVAEDGMELEGGMVYVIPPGAVMTVASGTLRIAPREPIGVSLPIDAFFQSLAVDRPEEAIGVVLSGTGSDGTRGLIALAQAGGWALVQEPESARFDGMPLNAIGTGMADLVGPPEDLAEKTQELVEAVGSGNGSYQRAFSFEDKVSIDGVLQLLRAVIPVDFRQYKPATVLRRVQRRMQATGISSLQAYSDHVAAHPSEVDTLRQELLIPVTSFFRDPEAFEVLERRVLRPLIESRTGGEQQPIRIWSAGCATGEEAYSLTILLLELIEEIAPETSVKVFATDVEATYVEKASLGRYPEAKTSGLSPQRRERFFRPLDGGLWQVRPELRSHIVFSRHDLLVDAPFTHLDLVACRNLLIYFQPAAQDRAIRRMSYALRSGGTLFLGSSESPSLGAGEYEVLDPRRKLYRLKRRAPSLPPEDLLVGRQYRPWASRATVPAARMVPEERDPVRMGLSLLTSKYAPPALLVTSERELVHVFGDARKLLRIAPGEATLDVLQLVVPEVMPVLATLLHTARRNNTPQRSRAVLIPAEEGEPPENSLRCRISVWPMQADGKPSDYLMIGLENLELDEELIEVEDAANLDDLGAQRVMDLERELAMTQSNLRDTIQELGTANEELQATNEELMASNEELQSTNEELQSVNEELHTVNAEYQNKIEEQDKLNADLESLTQATRLPLVFLDPDFTVTRLTRAATELFRIRETDTGRNILHFNWRLDYPQLEDDLRSVRDRFKPTQREVSDDEGRFWLVTCSPHRGGTHAGTRIVISCVDVSSIAVARRLQRILDAMPDNVAVLDSVGIITQVNAGWVEFGLANGETDPTRTGVGVNYLQVCQAIPGDMEAQQAADGLLDVLEGRRDAFAMSYPCHSPSTERWFVLSARALQDGGAVVTHFDLTPWMDLRAEDVQ